VHASNRLGQADDGLKLTDRDRDAVRLLVFLLVFGVLSVSHVHVLKHGSSLFSKPGENLHLSVSEVLAEVVEGDFGLTVSVHAAHVQVDDMVSNFLIKVFLTVVTDDEDSVETRQDTGLEINLFRSVFEVIVATEERVGSSQD